MACCLDISNPTVSKTISNPSLLISLLLGFTNLPSTYFAHSSNRSLFGSDIVIFLASLIFDNTSAHNKPMAPAP